MASACVRIGPPKRADDAYCSNVLPPRSRITSAPTARRAPWNTVFAAETTDAPVELSHWASPTMMLLSISSNHKRLS
jgi:hypothetical protein